MRFEASKPLSDLKMEAKIRVDTLAGEKRRLWLTITPGQDVTYARKLTDAQSYKSAGYPSNINDFIWVKAEAEARGMTPQQSADYIIATAGMWDGKGAAIEGARQKAKLIIGNATDAAGIHLAENTFRQELELIA